jgi:hypothetical protein
MMIEAAGVVWEGGKALQPFFDSFDGISRDIRCKTELLPL